MPTFKKSKNLKGNFTSDIINNAINDYLNKKRSLRDAARHYGLDHTTSRNYAIRAKQNNTKNIRVIKLSMVTRQVNILLLVSRL